MSSVETTGGPGVITVEIMWPVSESWPTADEIHWAGRQ